MYVCMYLANGLLHIKVFLTDKQNTVLSVSVCTDNFKRKGVQIAVITLHFMIVLI